MGESVENATPTPSPGHPGVDFALMDQWPPDEVDGPTVGRAAPA